MSAVKLWEGINRNGGGILHRRWATLRSPVSWISDGWGIAQVCSPLTNLLQNSSSKCADKGGTFMFHSASGVFFSSPRQSTRDSTELDAFGAPK